MPNTTNFNWPTPADTDLVKDGAAAIRSLGNSIDTAFVDLKGGTTGQNLRKASNTDLDFTFAGDATNTVIDAEGDLLVGDSADTLQRLAIGTTGQVLTADTSLDGKIKWAAPASSEGFTLLSTTTLAALSTTISGISGSYKHLVLYSKTLTDTDAGGATLSLQFNSDTGSNYSKTSIRNINNSLDGVRELSNDRLIINTRLQTTSTVTKLGSHAVWIYRYTDTNHIDVYYTSYGHTITGTQTAYETGYGQYDGTAAITSITIIGTTSLAGTVYLYGVN